MIQGQNYFLTSNIDVQKTTLCYKFLNEIYNTHTHTQKKPYYF